MFMLRQPVIKVDRTILSFHSAPKLFHFYSKKIILKKMIDRSQLQNQHVTTL